MLTYPTAKTSLTSPLPPSPLLLISQPTTKANLTVLSSVCDLPLSNARLERTCTEISLGLAGLERRSGGDVKVKDVHWQTERCAGVGHIHDAGHMALDGGAREQQVDLVVGVAKAAEVLDAAQDGLAVGDCYVHVIC